MIATKIHRDRVKPGREFRARLKLPNSEVKPHKSLLHEISRGLFVTGVPTDEPEKGLLIFANQLIERALISGLQSSHQRQIEICLWGAHELLGVRMVTSDPERREGHER
jgi:hypothetical protein